MSIISFWSSGKGETGKTSSLVAIATLMAINYNYKILVIDTKSNDNTYEECYWQEDRLIKLINDQEKKVDIGQGIGELATAVLSNKTSPEIITNYTRIVFKDRLEILTETQIGANRRQDNKAIYKEIAKMANKYYDLVFIDLDKDLDEQISDSLLEVSDLVVVCLQQKIKKIDEYKKHIIKRAVLKSKPIIPMIGRYDKHSKYNIKNVSRYLKEKQGICAIPYNTLFFEACNEGKVADFFIKFRKINDKDRNSAFIAEVNNAAEKIIARLRDEQMKI